MTVITGFIQTPHTLKTPTIQELIPVTTPYNAGVNRNPQRVTRTGIDGSTPDESSSETSAVASCTSTTPPSVCIWNGSI